MSDEEEFNLDNQEEKILSKNNNNWDDDDEPWQSLEDDTDVQKAKNAAPMKLSGKVIGN